MDHSYDYNEREYEYVATISSLKEELQELRETTDEEYAIGVKMAAEEREKFQSQIIQITKQRDDAILVQQIQQQHIDVLTNTVLQLEKELLKSKSMQCQKLNSSRMPEEQEENEDDMDDDNTEEEEEDDDDDDQGSSLSCVTVHIEEEEEEECSSSIVDNADVITTIDETTQTGGCEEKSQCVTIDCTTPNPIKLPFLSTWPDASPDDETTSSVVSSYNHTTTPSASSQHQVEYIYEAVQKKHQREGVFKSIFKKIVLAAPVVQQPLNSPDEHDSVVSYFSKEYNNNNNNKNSAAEGLLCKADVNLMGRCSYESVNYVKAQ